jgi:DNA-binding transcriptional LysR family regulator
MDFTALRYFFEAAQTGSIRQAAEHVHVAPSAISRQIAKLEHEVGTRLLERRANGVRLTPAGELLAAQLQITMRDLSRVRGQISELKGLRRGEVVVHCIEGLVDGFLIKALKKFNRAHPDITFQITIGSTDAIIDALVKDETDIGIVMNAQSRPEIASIGGWPEPLEAVISLNHPLASRKTVSLKELRAYPVVLPDRSFGIRRLVERNLLRTSQPINVAVTTNSIMATLSVARQGIAWTLMPPFAVGRDVAVGTIRTIPLEESDLEPALVDICTHKVRRLPLAASVFLKTLLHELPAGSWVSDQNNAKLQSLELQEIAAKQ